MIFKLGQQGWVRRAGGLLAMVGLSWLGIGSPTLHAQSAGEPDTPPQAIKKVKPIYPFAMRRANITGEVIVNFVVNSSGDVSAAQVEKASHPGFREAALDAIYKWRFKPAEVNGRKVNTRMRVPFTFEIQGAPSNTGWVIERPRSFPEELPEALTWHTAPVLKVYNPPVYPREALLADREGKVTVKFIVGPAGNVLSANVDDPKADPEFVGAGIAAVKTFEFEPARKRDGALSGALLNMTFAFDTSGRKSNAPVSKETKRILKLLENGGTEALPTLKDLDAVPRPVAQRAPTIPAALEKAGTPARAMVEFVISRQGLAALPRVVETTDEAFGYAAVQAVADWGFTAPLRDGEPVDVLARVPVEFKPQPEAASKP